MNAVSIINVNIPQRAYNIHIEEGLLKNLGAYIKKYYSGNRVSVITDGNVAGFYKEQVEKKLVEAGFEVEFFIIQPGEVSKSFSTFEKLQESLAQTGHQRTDLIIALGGGVVGDLAGFIAATHLRGVPFIQVPTSLLAQIDSSVGGKTGINLKEGKNLVGAIYQPKAVLIDPETLDTLPIRYLRDGIGEAIKYGFIDRPDLLSLFEGDGDESLTNSNDAFKSILRNRSQIIKICCESKRDFVIKDEMDLGHRMILNFGHTIGHAIEKVHGYKTYTHGEAVAMGMFYMTQITEALELSDPGQLERIESLLERFDLLNHDMYSDPKDWLSAISKDKKNLNNKLNIIYTTKEGQPVIHNTTLDEFYSMMKEVLA